MQKIMPAEALGALVKSWAAGVNNKGQHELQEQSSLPIMCLFCIAGKHANLVCPNNLWALPGPS
jgi:hypothetical protein